VAVSSSSNNRWEFNNAYLESFEKAGMMATGSNPESGLVEIVELKNHRWFVGVQFHPESILTEHGHDLLANFLKMKV